MLVCPKVDERTGEDIAAQVRTLLHFYVSDLHGRRPAGQVAEALTQIFARYGELIVDRINRAPERNLLAFLDMIGISPLPPRAAHVPLTFYLSAPSVSSALVPARSMVAAEQAKGETAPVIFETESDLPVVAAKLSSLYAEYPAQDTFRDWQQAIAPPTPTAPPGQVIGDSQAAPAVPDLRQLPHMLYVAIPARPVWPAENKIGLRFELQAPADAFTDPYSMQWELCVAPAAPASRPAQPNPKLRACGDVPVVPLAPEVDETDSFSSSGEVVFQDVALGAPVTIEGVAGHWLRLRLTTPITQGTEHRPDMVRAGYLPTMQNIQIHTEFELRNLPIAGASSNSLRLDTSKDFLPFGERPRFGDTFYVASDSFAEPDADVILHIQLTNPLDATDSPIPVVFPNGTKLQWQYWDGAGWKDLGLGEAHSGLVLPTARGAGGMIRFVPESSDGTRAFSDETRAFSVSGNVSFRFPVAPQPTIVNGQKGYWLRVRLAAGDYGREVSYGVDHESHRLIVTPATLAPPSIKSIHLDVDVRSELEPAAIITCNDFVTSRIDGGAAFPPFTVPLDSSSSAVIYFGFESTTAPVPAAPATTVSGTPRASRFPGRSMSLYVGGTDCGAHADAVAPQSVPLWEYWSDSQWIKWSALDDTRGLTRSGIISVLVPDDFAMHEKFGLNRYWLRMHCQNPGFDPSFKIAALNTTMAREGVTIVNEVLGSSNGRPSQLFRLANAPVLADQQLQVREPMAPVREEAARIRIEEGSDAMRHVLPSEGDKEQVWVRWHEVANLHGSKPRDRHYVLDRIKGEIAFGDGVNGQVPPALPGNIRVACYRVGGGVRGNKPPQTIKQFKTAIPFVNKALNWEAASGGIDPEANAALIERGPRWLRHGNRAVTPEDFEDLARTFAPLVARAKCYALSDLEKDRARRFRYPGVVSLVIIPRSTSLAPTPNHALLDDVRNYLEQYVSPVVRLVLVGPRYLPVDVETTVVIDDLRRAGEIDQAITSAIRGYLHPVTGRRDGAGWDFERLPHHSDLCGLIEDVAGVSYVEDLRFKSRFSSEIQQESGDFLICPGNQRVIVRPPE
jgi:hypothetical protein